ncbi:hypothetical protein VHEMI10741 [[Torrubiella] hemipterigena]|uniref:Uncharacterized protein n=1 Tax=[Torrubiella] hemipterigena TaxID=1531966 RepID=A0A0A1TSE8_9HYPO|nr:hypothetical protein VHEMI10741 [[Torrubiella] hemipterigena]
MPSAAAEKLTGYSIKQHITAQLQLSPTQLLDARRIPSGWSVILDNITTRDKILAKQAQWLPGLKAEVADKKETWHTYVVDNVPRTLHDIMGNATGVLQAAKDEIVAQTKLQPVEFHIARKDTGSLPNRRWNAHGDCLAVATSLVSSRDVPKSLNASNAGGTTAPWYAPERPAAEIAEAETMAQKPAYYNPDAPIA